MAKLIGKQNEILKRLLEDAKAEPVMNERVKYYLSSLKEAKNCHDMFDCIGDAINYYSFVCENKNPKIISNSSFKELEDTIQNGMTKYGKEMHTFTQEQQSDLMIYQQIFSDVRKHIRNEDRCDSTTDTCSPVCEIVPLKERLRRDKLLPYGMFSPSSLTLPNKAVIVFEVACYKFQ